MIDMAYTPTNQRNRADDQGKTAKISTDTFVMLHVHGAKTPIIFRPKKRVTLGRHHDLTPRKPDIDLIPYGAHDQGVSRIHAAILFKDDEILIMDMGSCNGTWLNNNRLVAGKPHPLNDGDQVRLGRLNINVGIKVKAEPPDHADEMMTIPAVRRQQGAGMLRTIEQLRADYSSEEKEDTLVMPELQRKANLPNVVEQVGRNKQVGEYNRVDTDPRVDPTSTTLNTVRPLRPREVQQANVMTNPERVERGEELAYSARRQLVSTDQTIYNRSSVIRPLLKRND